jgi:hypothetical protein
VVTTLFVTFALTVGLAAAVLLSVAAPPMRRRGSRLIARIDAWAGRVIPVVRQHRARVAARVAERLEAQRQSRGDEQRTARAR